MTGLGTASAAETVRDLRTLRQMLSEAPGGAALHPLGLEGILLGAGVVAALPDLVDGLRRREAEVVLLADCRRMRGATPDVKESIEEGLRAAGIATRRVIVGDTRASVHADAATIDGAVEASAEACVLVSVGSGTVADVGKAVSARLDGLPHVVVQTAGSVNGFADDQSVLLVDGVKRTTPTRWPDWLVIDTDILSRAPEPLNRAGLGDLLATYTAPADWLLASVVGQDASYSTVVVELARSTVDEAVGRADGIGSGDPGAIESLAASLALSGISMGVAGRTSPGSGMEHTVSHLLEMADGEHATPLHGAKVGALSVLSALLWTHVRDAARAGALHALRFPSADEMRDRVIEAFSPLDETGRMADECWQDYSRKLERWHGAANVVRELPARWAALDARLDELVAAPERLVGALRSSGAPTRLSELGIEPSVARWALANCHLMRDRFTVADLAFLMGAWEPDDVERLLEEAATLGAGL